MGTAYEITYDLLRAALNMTDVDTASPSILITAVDSGTVQKWNGASLTGVIVIVLEADEERIRLPLDSSIVVVIMRGAVLLAAGL